MLVQRWATKAQVYPEALCDAICRGIKQQLEQDRKGQLVLGELKIGDPTPGMRECQQTLCNLANGKVGEGPSPMAAPQPTATYDHED